MLSTAAAQRLENLLFTLGTTDRPSCTELQILIRDAFWASLEKEEGRPTCFTLAFGAPQGGPSGQPLILAESQDLTVHQIIKLAPALRRGRTALGITAVAQELKLWGMAPLPNPSLTIEAMGPGHLVLRILNRNRLILRSGKETFLPNNQSDNLLYLVNTVSEYQQPMTPRFLIKVEALQQVITAMLRQGHGGTLLWVPDDLDWQSSVKSIRYPCQPTYRELADFTDQLALQFGTEFDFKGEDHRTSQLYSKVTLGLLAIQPLIEAIGQLTAVDGATVIDENLEVSAFGLMLRSEGVDSGVRAQVLELGQAVDDTDSSGLQSVALADLGGARHRSAAEFCCTHPRCLAFVASQDGGLTVFGWQGVSNQLFAIRGAELDSL